MLQFPLRPTGLAPALSDARHRRLLTWLLDALTLLVAALTVVMGHAAWLVLPLVVLSAVARVSANAAVRRSDRASRRQAERYFQKAGTMLLDLDREGRVRAINEAGCAVVGRSAEELVGADWFAIALTSEYEPQGRAAYAEVIGRGELRREHVDLELVASCGEVRHVQWHSELLHDEHGRVTGMLCAGTDVTDRRRMEEQLQAEQRELGALHRLAQDVGALEDARPAVVEHVRSLTGAAWVALSEREGDEIVVTAVAGEVPLRGVRVNVEDRSLQAKVMASGRAVFAAEAATDERISPRLLEVAPDTRSIYCRPVMASRSPLGVLTVGWHRPVASVSVREAALVAVAGHEASVALERRATVRRLEALALTDALTELPNRRLWDRELPIALARARRSQTDVAVAMLDLNAFKQHNDVHGHDAGDTLLREAARAWQDVLRGTDVLVRLGGDEFALLLPDCGQDGAEATALRLQDAVPHGAGVSVGVAVWDRVETGDELVRRADQALYADKATAREARLEDPARLAALAALALAGSAELDRLAEVAAWLAEAPSAAVTLLDDQRQHIVASCGLSGPAVEEGGTALSGAICRHTVASGRPFVVADCREHPLLVDHPAVADGVLAYAGVPLVDADGQVLGALCAFDGQPRAWSDDHVSALQTLAVRVVASLTRP